MTRACLVFLSLILITASTRRAEASVSVVLNGTTYTIPQKNEKGWGDQVTSWIQAASLHLLQKTGGSFTLSNDVDFGGSFGLLSAYYKTKSANIASAGAFRLANTDLVEWRNTANSGNLALGVNTSDQLTYNGNPIIGSSALTASRALQSDAGGAVSASSVTATELGYVSGVTSSLCGINQSCTVTNKTLAAGSNHVTGTIGKAAQFNATTGDLEASGVSTTTLAFLDATSSVQTQLNGKQATGNYITALTGDVSASGPGSAAATISGLARSKLASGTSNYVVINDGTGVMSQEAQLATSRGGTGVSSTATFPSSGTVATVPASGVVKSSGTALTSGAVSIASGSSEITGTLAIANGGTGQTSANAALNAFLPTQTSNGGKYLQTDGSNTSWASTTAANLSVATKTTTYTATTSDDVILVDSSGGAWTLTLPAASNTGKVLRIKKTTSDFNAVTIGTVDGGTRALYTQNEAYAIVADGTNWKVIDHKTDTPWVSYTPTLTGFGTATNVSVWWRRVGDSIQIRGYWTNGTVSASTAQIAPPSGVAIASAKLPSTANVTVVGRWQRLITTAGPVDTGAGNLEGEITYDGSTTSGVFFSLNQGSGIFNKGVANSLWNSSEGVAVNFEVPVSGWTD